MSTENENILEKPFVFPSRAKNNEIPVNLNTTVTFAKQDKPDVRNKAAGTEVTKKEYCIMFYSNEVAQEGQVVVWRYNSENCRNSDYNELKAKFSVTLGS